MMAITKRLPKPESEWSRGFDYIDMPEPNAPEGDDVLVEVVAAAICGTDVGIYSSKESLAKEMINAEADPLIVGHEFAGKIVDLGDTALEFLGKMLGRGNDASLKNSLINDYHLTAEMHVTCGKCLQCQLGEMHVCKNTKIKGIHQHGVFTKLLTLPAENVVLIEKGAIPIEVTAFMDAIGNAVHTVMEVGVEGKNIAILGCGVQGLMATAIAKQMGAKQIFVTDASHPKLGMTHERLESTHFDMARRFGADACFDMAISENRQKFVDFVLDNTDNIGVDGVLEMSGNYRAYEDAFKIIRAGGIFSLLGLPSGEFELDFARDVIFKGVTIKGIIGRRVWETWDKMTDLLKTGLSDTFVNNDFITHDLPLSDYENAFGEIFSGNALKVLLRPE